MGGGVKDFDLPPAKKNDSLERMEKLASEKEKAEAENLHLRKTVEKLGQGIEPALVLTRTELEAAKQRIEYSDEKLHIAIAGTAGSGKSSLINAFRRLEDDETGAAEIGFTETTVKMTRYPDTDPELPYSRFVWYDIPGSGTQTTDDWQYVKNQALFAFDAIILVTDNRFLKSDAVLLKHCMDHNVPTFIVRSKADQQIMNIQRKLKNLTTWEQRCNHLVKETRKSIKKGLAEDNLKKQKVYVVSSDGAKWAADWLYSRTMFDVEITQPNELRLIHEKSLLKDVLFSVYRRRYKSDEVIERYDKQYQMEVEQEEENQWGVDCIGTVD